METKTVTLKGMDTEVWKQLRVMAIQEGITIAGAIKMLLEHYDNNYRWDEK